MTTSKRGFIESVWDFFCSLKLSISLLICLAVTSIIGTVIPQNPQPEYLQTIGEAKIKLYSVLGFFDMYHSWWFILLLYLLTVNLMACSIKRLPRVWKFISEPTLVFDDGLEKTLSLTHHFKMSGDVATLRDKMSAFLKGEFSTPRITEKNGEYHLFSEKTPYCRLGVYVVHASIIIIFVGALIGSFFGYKGYVNIEEGTGVSAIAGRNGRMIDLGYTVRCDKFSVTFYDTGAPKEFKSILTVLENGQPIAGYQNIPIVVNSPLTYKGITFYQSSYGPAGAYNLTVRKRDGGAATKIMARQGETISLANGGSLQVIESTPDINPFMPQFSGPAIRVDYHPPNDAHQSIVLIRDYPDFDLQRNGDQVFTFAGGEEKFYTGLQVAKDPGVWVVWFGCTLMVLGIMIAFFLSHKRVWIRVAIGKIVIGGTANKNPAAFESLFDGLVEKLKKL